jgi:hypothetical protein
LVQHDRRDEAPHVVHTLHKSSFVLRCVHGNISVGVATSTIVAFPIYGVLTRRRHSVPAAFNAAEATIGAVSNAARSARNGQFDRGELQALIRWHSIPATAAVRLARAMQSALSTWANGARSWRTRNGLRRTVQTRGGGFAPHAVVGWIDHDPGMSLDRSREVRP